MGEVRHFHLHFQFWQLDATKDQHLLDQILCLLEALATAKGVKIVGKKRKKGKPKEQKQSKTFKKNRKRLKRCLLVKRTTVN